MIAGLATIGATPLHRLSAAVKLGALAGVATALFFVEDLRLLAVAGVLALALARSTGHSFARLGRDLAGPALVLGLVGAADWLFLDGTTAATVVLRLAAIALLAHAVTVTTTTSELTEVLERLFRPAERLGLLDADRAALTVALTLRFVPLVVEEAREIREAQAARGLEGSILALAVPLLVRIVVRAQDLADAIDARGFPPDRSRPGNDTETPGAPAP